MKNPDIADITTQAFISGQISQNELSEMAGPETSDEEEFPIEEWEEDGTKYREFHDDGTLQYYNETKGWRTIAVAYSK